MNYDQNFEPAPLVDTFKKSRKNIRDITKKYIRLLLPIGALRAISTAIGQKMLELGIDVFIRTPKSSILIIVAGFG
jgi:hypothetical protein